MNRIPPKWNITQDQIAAAPKISHLLNMLEKRSSMGLSGRDLFIEILRGSADAKARQFIIFFDQQPTKTRRSDIPVEAFCVAAKLCPNEMFALAVAEARQQSARVSSMLAALKQPAVVSRSINEALTPGGVEDRMAQLRHSGFLPLPKGSQVNVYASASALAAAQAEAKDTRSDVIPEDTIRRLGDRFNAQKALPPPVEGIGSMKQSEPEYEYVDD